MKQTLTPNTLLFGIMFPENASFRNRSLSAPAAHCLNRAMLHIQDRATTGTFASIGPDANGEPVLLPFNSKVSA